MVDKEEKRQVLAIVFWNPETDELDYDAIDQIPIEEVKALLARYEICPKRG